MRPPGRQVSAVPAWLRWGLPVIVAAISFVAFWPALGNDFVSWDDDKNFLENHHYRGLGAEQLEWMFAESKMGHYHPLTWITLAADYCIWGMNPLGYHLGNLILHALNAAWFYLLALRLLEIAMPAPDGRRGMTLHLGAAAAALFFSVHPLRVESVAWATERRDVLSTFFLLPCVICYLRYAAGVQQRGRWYVASVVLLVLSLASKAWGMTLPAVLLLLDFYPLRRLRWRVADLLSPTAMRAYVDKIPFIVVGGVGAYLAAWAQSSAGDTMKSLEQYGIAQRIAQAFYGLAFYPWKTFVPVGLAPIYEIPIRMDPYAWPFVLAAVAVVAATLLLVVFRTRWPAGLASWMAYGMIVSPVLGIAQSGPQLAADRYSYISCMSLALLAGAGLIACLRLPARGAAPADRRRSGLWRWPVVGAALGVVAGVVVSLATLTWRQTHVWRSSRTLWEHTLAVDPNSYNAHQNLGIILKQNGHLEEARTHYLASLDIYPDNYGAINNLGSILLREGKTEQALDRFRQAHRLRPNDLSVYMNIATCHHKLKEYDKAIGMYRQIINVNRFHPKAYSNLGQALASTGNVDAAIEALERAIQLEPKYAKAYNNLAFAYRKKGDLPKAIGAFLRTAELVRDKARKNPKAPERDLYVKACSNLGKLYTRTDELDEAIRHHRMVLDVRPDRLFDLMQMGDLLLRLKRYDEAATYYRRALQVRPDHKPALQGLQRAEQGRSDVN